MAHFDAHLRYSDILILKFCLQCKAKYIYMNTRQGQKVAFISTLQLQQFRLQNEAESSGFLSRCTEHVVWHRTVLAFGAVAVQF